MTILPVTFTWTVLDVADEFGEIRKVKAMVPLRRFDNIAARQFDEGSDYPLVVQQVRSRKSHNFYFASLQDGYDSLPENITARWDTMDAMRKWILVETGWFEEKEFDFEGRNAALNARRLGAFIRTEDVYARVYLHEITKTSWKVIVRRPKSQSEAAMGTEDFKASCRAVLEHLEHMIGVAKGTLKREAGKHA